MRIALLLPALLVIAAAPAAAAFDYSRQLGIAEQRSGAWCLAIGGAELKPGAVLRLYEPYGGLQAAARVEAPAPQGCEELKSRFQWPRQPDAPFHLYRITPEDAAAAAALTSAGALFAFLDAPSGAIAAGADLDGDGAPDRPGICTSSEGLHFFIASGGRVLWHAYYYLGVDVKPDCPDAIFKE